MTQSTIFIVRHPTTFGSSLASLRTLYGQRPELFQTNKYLNGILDNRDFSGHSRDPNQKLSRNYLVDPLADIQIEFISQLLQTIQNPAYFIDREIKNDESAAHLVKTVELLFKKIQPDSPEESIWNIFQDIDSGLYPRDDKPQGRNADISPVLKVLRETNQTPIYIARYEEYSRFLEALKNIHPDLAFLLNPVSAQPNIVGQELARKVRSTSPFIEGSVLEIPIKITNDGIQPIVDQVKIHARTHLPLTFWTPNPEDPNITTQETIPPEEVSLLYYAKLYAQQTPNTQ